MIKIVVLTSLLLGTFYFAKAQNVSMSFHDNLYYSSDTINKFLNVNGDLFNKNMPNPQVESNWDKPGCYEIAAVLSKSVLKKGDSVDMRIFVTGYGICKDTKFYFNCSSPIFESESKITSGIGLVMEGGFKEKLIYETTETIFGDYNRYSAHIAGLNPYKKWEYMSPFFDINARSRHSHRIMTEMNINGNGLINGHLKLLESANAGDYTFDIYFTYFNGQEWKISKNSLPFHVNYWYENYSSWAFIFGIISSVGIGEFVKRFLIYLFEKIRFHFFKRKKTEDKPEIKRKDDKVDSTKGKSKLKK